MKRVTSFRVGRFRCHCLEAGSQRLDGGAMFGVVPKPLWERRIAPDERNRIPLALRCLAVEHDDGLVLLDTGIGNKESEKFRDIYGVENSGTRGPTALDDALHDAGFAAEDVRYVINTHLHFDHAGGNTVAEAAGAAERRIRLAFRNATYVVQEGELAFARAPNERTGASYLAPNFEPVATAERWRLVRGETEVLPGIVVMPTPGHVPYHQSVLIADGEDVACFLGDLVPTSAHVPLPWIMGYDLEPLVTLERKRSLLGRAAAEGWLVVFEHDPHVALARIERDAKSFVHKPVGDPAA